MVLRREDGPARPQDTSGGASKSGRMAAMSSPPTPLRFCFDLISHNAYLAWTQIHALA